MIVTWTDSSGVQHWGEENSKAHQRHLASQRSEKPAPAGQKVAKPAVVTSTEGDKAK